MRPILTLAEKGFVILTLLLSTEAFLTFVPKALRQPIWLLIYALSLFLMVLRWRQAAKVVMRGTLVWVLVGFVVFSMFWSDAPDVTLRQSIAVIGTTLFGVYLATRYSLSEQLKLLALVFGIVAVLSLVFAVALPSYGLQGGQSWQGIYHHKNMLGRIMILSGVVFVLMIHTEHKRRWMAWGGAGLSTMLLLLSNSKTALALYGTLVILLPLYRAMRLYYKLAVPLLIGAVLSGGAIAMIVLASVETVLESAGKDLTLSGRTDLWGLVLDMIQLRPWLGYGFGGFWRGWNGASAYIWTAEWWLPMHSHNGYLNLWLDLGLVGLMIFGFSFLMVLRRAIIWVRSTNSPEYLMPLSFLTFMLLYNLTESVILLQNTIFWILYVTIAFSRLEQDERLSKPPYGRAIPSNGGYMQNA